MTQEDFIVGFFCFLLICDLCQMVSLPHTVGQRAKSFSFLRNNFYCLFTGTRNFPHGEDKEILSPDLGISQVPTLGSQTQQAVLTVPGGAFLAWCGVGDVMLWGWSQQSSPAKHPAGLWLQQCWGWLPLHTPAPAAWISMTVGQKPFST